MLRRRRNPDAADAWGARDSERLKIIDFVLDYSQEIFKANRSYRRLSLVRRFIESLAYSGTAGAYVAAELLFLYDQFLRCFQERMSHVFRGMFPEFHLHFIRPTSYFHFHFDAMEFTIYVAAQRLLRRNNVRAARIGVASESEYERRWAQLMRRADNKNLLYVYGEMLDYLSERVKVKGLSTTEEDLDVLIRVYLVEMYDALKRRSRAKSARS